MIPRGDIFWSDDAGTQRTLRFAEAFPEIENVAVEVLESGHGNDGLGVRRFNKNSVREFINCSSEHCAGKAFWLGRALRKMVRERRSRLRLEFACESGAETATPCENRFDVLIKLTFKTEDARGTTSPFGMLTFLHWDHDWNQHHFTSSSIAQAAALLREAGVGMVRMDFLWSDLEPQENVFDWKRYDAIIDALRQQNVCVLGILNYNPLWRQTPWNQAPDAAAYNRYARAVVQHFRDRIRYWEIWNEPDHPNYWQPQDGLSAYGTLLVGASAAIREEDPTARIVMGGLSQNISANLRQLYEKAGREAFDVVNFHPFANPLELGALDFVERICRESIEVMRAFHDEDKPIWLTEIGCPGVPIGKEIKNWWLGKNPTEAEQAAWLETVYATALKWPNVERVFWAFFRDTPNHFGDGVDYFGIVREDFSKKAAFKKFHLAARH